MPTDAENAAECIRQYMNLKSAYEAMLSENIDLKAKLASSEPASRSWSDSAISLLTWIGTNKTSIAATLMFFYLGYREAFPKLPTPAPVNPPVQVAPVVPQQPVPEVKGGAVPLREGK